MAAQHSYQDETTPVLDTKTTEYESFSNLPIFNAASLTVDAANPRLARAWVNATVRYWKNGIANGQIKEDQTLYLLDMAPHDSQTAWLLINALTQYMAAQDINLPWCYLACHDDTASAEHHAGHPYFREWIAAGRIDFVHWNTAHTALHLSQQNITLTRSENPLVIIANGYLQTQAADLFCLHKGQLMQGTVASTLDVDDAGKNTHNLKYQWQTSDATSPYISESVLAHYRHHCNGAALQLPLAACAMLDKINRFAQGRTMLLAADPGVCNEKQIRLGALCPPTSWKLGDAPPPVNFHALSLQQREQGAWVWQQQLDDAGLVVHMAICDDTHTMTKEDFNAIAATLADAHPDDMRQLASTQYSAADTLTLLRLSHYDPKILRANIAAFIEQPLALSESARRNWQQALVNTWCNFLPGKAYDGFYYQVGLMAAHIGHYGLAKECFRLGLAWYGDAATDHYLLAWCEATSGGVDRAVKLLASALALEPDHAPSLELSATLHAQLARWQQNSWHLPHTVASNALQLEPLGQEHAAALLYQYRDRQIGIMTCLPALDTIEDTEAWIAKEQLDAGRASFAVMHECWGLVGMVSIHCSRDAGYFYFWTGSDFQEQGLGQQAAQLLFEIMAQHGITEIFTSAYEDNLRSIHALTRLGFNRLDVRAKAPDMDLLFFHLKNNDVEIHGLNKLNLKLSELCKNIDSPIQFL